MFACLYGFACVFTRFPLFVCVFLCGFCKQHAKNIRKTTKKQTKEPLEDDIKSGSGPAEKNNSKKYTFEYVKIHFFGQTKGGALLKKNKNQENEKETRGVVKREKKNEKETRGVKKQK